MGKNKSSSVKYPENRELRKQLRKGEMLDIAELSGYDVTYVRNVLGGTANNDEIIAWTKRVISDRVNRLKQIVNPTIKSNKYQRKLK